MKTANVIETLAPTIKGRNLERPKPLARAASETAFEALLYPNRSLPNSGFIVLMSIVIGVNVALGVMFTLIGAWPVLVFGGLDILLVWVAFKTSYAQGRLHERVRVTPDEMLISRVLPSGHEMRWSLQPYWTDIELDDPVRHESQIKIRTKGRVMVLGSFLSPKEREAFGKRLRGAIFDARRASV